MSQKTITLSIEFSPTDYASLKAFAECESGSSIDEVLSKALSAFLEKESKEKVAVETLRNESSNENNLHPVKLKYFYQENSYLLNKALEY